MGSKTHCLKALDVLTSASEKHEIWIACAGRCILLPINADVFVFSLYEYGEFRSPALPYIYCRNSVEQVIFVILYSGRNHLSALARLSLNRYRNGLLRGKGLIAASFTALLLLVKGQFQIPFV